MPTSSLHRTPLSKLHNRDRVPRSIAVLRALQVGDLLCAVPALRALRAAFPEARITLIGLPWARDFVKRFGRYVNDFIEFPGLEGLPERTPDKAAFPSFLNQVRARHFDIVLQMHGSGATVNKLVAQLGARLCAGFYSDAADCLDSERFMPYPDGLPEIRRHLALMQFLGIKTLGETLEFPLLPEDEAAAQHLLRLHKLIPGQFVCVHAGARARARRWLPERFAVVADEIAFGGLPVVLTGSTEEMALTQQVARHMRAPAINLAGPMPLGALAGLINRARLLVSNDTGVSHVACGLGVASVIIFTGSDPARWAPLNPILHRGVHADVHCRPCSYMDCPIGHPCATQVEPRTVLQEVKSVLHREMAYAI